MKFIRKRKNILNENYFKSVDKLKGKIDKRLTANDIRNQAKQVLIEPILNDENFLRKCGNCFKQYIHVNATSTSLGVINFRFADLVDSTLHVICDAYYTVNESQRNRVTAKSVLIENKLFDESIEEINESIDLFVTYQFCKYFKKNNPEVLDIVKEIHVKRINLWANAPESINGLFPKLTVQIHSEYYYTKVLSENELVNLFDKVTKLFTFCVKDLIYDRKDLVFNLMQDSATACPLLIKKVLDYNAKFSMNKLDDISNKRLSRKNLNLYAFLMFNNKIDLNKFLRTKSLKDSSIISVEYGLSREYRVITTATEEELDSVHSQLGSYLFSAVKTSAPDVIPNTINGPIKYLAIICIEERFNGTAYLIGDYIDGKFHIMCR